MRIERLIPTLAPAWDAYVAMHPDGWFWGTSAWLEYQRHYRPGNRDCSFALLEGERIIATVPVMVSSGGGGPEFSYSGDPLPPGLSDGAEAAAACSSRLLALARETGAARALIASSPFGGPIVFVLPGNEMCGIEIPPTAAHRVIALTAEPCELWHGVRKSYRALVHRGERRYTLTAYTGDHADAVAGFVAYQALHRRLATLPRSGETYRLQGEWLLDGRALVVIAERPEGVLGAIYWIIYKNAAYYGSGAYAADDVGHVLMWRSLLELRALGVRRADLDSVGQTRAEDEVALGDWTEKERNIRFFKAGFGGAYVPVQVAEVRFLDVAPAGRSGD